MVLIIVVVVTGREECCMKGEEVRRRAQRDDRIGPGQRVAKKRPRTRGLSLYHGCLFPMHVLKKSKLQPL